jgi:acetylornithine deacetylase/succinyl-diaminopimelate desuccinylase-like protein
MPGRFVGVLRALDVGPTALLNGHIDVCEDRLLDRWSSNAYEPVLRDGRLFGRGASDMKSALASFLLAVTVLREQDVRLRRDVILQK